MSATNEVRAASARFYDALNRMANGCATPSLKRDEAGRNHRSTPLCARNQGRSPPGSARPPPHAGGVPAERRVRFCGVSARNFSRRCGTIKHSNPASLRPPGGPALPSVVKGCEDCRGGGRAPRGFRHASSHFRPARSPARPEYQVKSATGSPLGLDEPLAHGRTASGSTARLSCAAL